MQEDMSATKPIHQITDPATAARLLPVIYQITGVLNNKRLGFDHRLDAILKIVLAYLGVEQGSVMLLENKKYLVVRASSRRKDLVGHRHSMTTDSISSWVARNHEPLFLQDISSDPRFQNRTGDDNYRTNSLLSVPIMHHNQLLGVFNVTDRAGSKDLLNEDISYLMNFCSFVISLIIEQKLHTEIKKQQNRLREQHRELLRQENMRAELSKMLIHDLKGPLSEVVANLDILSYSVAEDNREFLESAQLACDRAIRMAANLATISKIEDGRMQLILETVSPESLLVESVTNLKGLARIKGVELVVDPAAGKALPLITIDRVLILRVLQNLIINAVGHTEGNSRIMVGCHPVSGRKRLEFYVIDQGAGIPESEQRTIFEKYARLSTKQDGLTGSGLGLYFCRLAVEAHHGQIGVENVAAGGSRFFFTVR